MIPLFRFTRFAIPFLVFVLLVLFFWKGLGTDPRLVPSALINQPMPSFSLPTLDNPQQKLDRGLFVGQVSVLHAWASWCSTCQSEHPFWVDIAKTHSVKLYGLLYKDARFSAQAWLKNHQNPYQQIIDDESGRLGMDLGMSGVPETFLIDSEGVVRYKLSGPIDKRIWSQEFVPRIQLLNGKTEELRR